MLIGASTIDLEDRWYSHDWRTVLAARKPVEHRALFHAGHRGGRAPVGFLTCVVEVMKATDAPKRPAESLARPPRAPYEVRILIYKVEDVPNENMLDPLLDMFVRCSLNTGGLEDDEPQETDTHFRAEDGVGSFNWRMKFDVDLPTSGEGAGLLTLQVWDTLA